MDLNLITMGLGFKVYLAQNIISFIEYFEKKGQNLFQSQTETQSVIIIIINSNRKWFVSECMAPFVVIIIKKKRSIL